MNNSTSKETCPTCWSRYTVDRDEDGYPGEVPGDYCADVECGKKLCPTCLEHFSFQCDGCGERYCDEHKRLVEDGTDRPLQVCGACAVEGDLLLVPPMPMRPITVEVARPKISEWVA